jgi:hypothetical protein
MKSKTIYLLMIICSMSLLSSAKNGCDKTICNGFSKQKCPKQALQTAEKEADLSLPPLQVMFTI